MLRILSGFKRKRSSPSSLPIDSYNKIFFDDPDRVQLTMELLQNCGAPSLRTKVFLQTMAILSPTSLPPSNLGSVLTVGGFPTLNSVIDVFSCALVGEEGNPLAKLQPGSTQ